MRKSISLIILIFVFVTAVRILFSGVQARVHGVTIPYLMMLPASLSMLLSLVFAADRIYFRRLEMKTLSICIVTSTLFMVSVIFMLLGGSMAGQMDTVQAVPGLLVFIIFPLSIPFTDRLGLRKQDGVDGQRETQS